MPNLYTILVNFSDHLIGIGQYEATSADDAVRQFIDHAECFEEYDRELLANRLSPLLHIAGTTGGSKRDKGLWAFIFSPEAGDRWPNDNPVLGGHVIQTDPNGPTREPNL